MRTRVLSFDVEEELSVQPNPDGCGSRTNSWGNAENGIMIMQHCHNFYRMLQIIQLCQNLYSILLKEVLDSEVHNARS